MQLFYEPNLLTNNGVLNKKESHHCIKVLRHKKGDAIKIIDGKGRLFYVSITDDSPKECSVLIDKQINAQYDNAKGHIAIAPTKSNDRTEWFVEKATELGINSITPLFCENSIRKSIKPYRLEKIITSAIKQSGELYRPVLNESIPFKELINKEFKGDKFIAYCNNKDSKHLKELVKKGRETLIVIGPEGDFSQEEIELAQQKGFIPVSLGSKRLRTETAAIVANNIIQLINE
ncbi:16S rRNA (uracil(1498)-N(3))-methyltransferase [Marinilabiliaceae bacterium ANBcel2]|nr:16S rRNA (uracil(1498)-N(3))-methyltransferase [Marinilabiliaceae bacterium ANBcel2]